MSDTNTQPTAPRPAQATTQTVTDTLGRVLTIREIGPIQQLDLFEAAGDQSNNSPWIGMAMIAASVSDIDGVPMPFPRDKAMVRSMLGRLGREGVAAAATAMRAASETEAVDVVAAAKN